MTLTTHCEAQAAQHGFKTAAKLPDFFRKAMKMMTGKKPGFHFLAARVCT